jgi:hypothetical protein
MWDFLIYARWWLQFKLSTRSGRIRKVMDRRGKEILGVNGEVIHRSNFQRARRY